MHYKNVGGRVMEIDSETRELIDPTERVLGSPGNTVDSRIHALIIKDLRRGKDENEGDTDRLREAYLHTLWAAYYMRLALYERDGR